MNMRTYVTCLNVAWLVYSSLYMAGIIVESGVSIPSEVVSRNTACRGSLFSASCSAGKLVVRDLYFGFKDYSTLGGMCYIDDVASVSDPCCVYNNTDDCLVAEDDKTSIRATVTGESSPEVLAADILDSSCYSNNVQSQYMLMEYYCIPDSMIVTCSGTNSPLTVTDGSALYLYNMNYFEECSCSVEMANCTSPLTVDTIVLDLYSDAGECHHTVNITDGGVSQTLTCDDNTCYTVSNRTADSNYLLISFTRTTAGTGGSWMGFTAPQGVQLRLSCPPTDQASCDDCNSPSVPFHGKVSTPNGRTYDQRAEYTCDQGYDMIGENISSCLENGTWNYGGPQCDIVDCGAPSAPGNGAVSTSSGTAYDQSGTYTCDQGYGLEGDGVTTCLANGTWSNAESQCVHVSAGDGGSKVTKMAIIVHAVLAVCWLSQ